MTSSRRLQRSTLVTATSIVFAVGGCGGGEASFYDRAAVEGCLQDKGYSAEEVSDAGLALVGGPAAHGVIEIESEDGIGVDIAFEGDADAAAGRAEALQGAAQAFGGDDASDVTKTKGNVTYWAIDDDPPEETFADVDSCLSE